MSRKRMPGLGKSLMSRIRRLRSSNMAVRITKGGRVFRFQDERADGHFLARPFLSSGWGPQRISCDEQSRIREVGRSGQIEDIAKDERSDDQKRECKPGDVD